MYYCSNTFDEDYTVLPVEKYFNFSEFEQIIRANEQPPFAYRNRALLFAATFLFLKPYELTLLELDTVMLPNGDIKPEFMLPDYVAIDGNERPIIVIDVVARVLKRMIQWWVDNGLYESGKPAYMGRDPKARLFISDKFAPYELTKRKASEAATHPVSMNKKLNSFIANTSIRGATVKTFRNSGIRMVNANSTMTDAQIVKMAGFSKISLLKKILSASEEDLTRNLDNIFRSC